MKKILFLLVILFSLFSCEDGTLVTIEEPEPTDVFRCKVNGEEWKPEGEFVGFGDPNPDIQYENYFLDAIQIRVSREIDDIDQFISISVSVIDGVIGDHPIINNKVFIDFKCGSYYRDTTKVNTICIMGVRILQVQNLLEARMPDWGWSM